MRPSRVAVQFLGSVLAFGLVISCGGTVVTPTSTLTPPSSPGNTQEPPNAVDLASFKVMARAGGCADIRNRLFLIDDQLVFWDRAGNCADAAYAQTLYGSTPDEILCTAHDSIAGPRNECQDERYRDMFDTMTANLDKPDLGLGPGHTVQPVRF